MTAMELYLLGNLLLTKIGAIDKRVDELLDNRTPEEFGKAATEEEAIEFMILYELREECEKDYEIWKTEKDKLLKG